jgi:dUTP pyrophosphatase
MTELKIKRLSVNAKLPTKGSSGAAGYDLYSAVEIIVPARSLNINKTIWAGQALIATDISIQVPKGTYGRVAPRSGLALKNGIDVGAGVIDSDFCGNVGVILFNHGQDDFHIKVGDRIAQLILEKIETDAIVVEVDELEKSERGNGGFGSTGL